MGMLPKDENNKANNMPSNPSIIYNGYLANGKPVHIDSEVAEWLARDGLTKIVVGHQPNGDTPFTIDEMGIQAVSADISYSKFVQWRQEDLKKSVPLMKSPSGPIDFSTLKDSPLEWMDYDKFKTTVVGLAAAPQTPSTQADTRNENMVNEFLQIIDIPSSSSSSSANDDSSPPLPSLLSMHGRNCLGATYNCDIPSKSSLSSSSDPSSSSAPLVGTRLSDDWWIKAVNVRFPYNLEDEYYLLSYSEGFTFKNRLISIEDFEEKYGKEIETTNNNSCSEGQK
jgi:hypothetical protein